MQTPVTLQEDWMNSKWRPAMGWTYMAICILDFAVFPIAWSILQAVQGGEVTSQWFPITLQGAGLFHAAMGGVLGVVAWSRGREKLAEVNEIRDRPVDYREYPSYNYRDTVPPRPRRGKEVPQDYNYPEI